MPAKKYHVALTEEERASLEQLLRRGQHSTRKLTRARILLKADAGLDDEAIADEVQTSRPTVERLRRRFNAMRLEALAERPRPGRTPKLDEKGEARLIAEACSTAPEGRECWTLQLLAERVVALQLSEACSRDTVRRALKKTNSSPGANSSGVFRKSAERSWPRWKMCWRSTPSPMTRNAQRSTSTRPVGNCWRTCGKGYRPRPADPREWTASMNETGRATSSSIANRRLAGGTWLLLSGALSTTSRSK